MFKILYDFCDELYLTDKNVSDTRVRYDWFLGDIKLQIDSKCIDLSWGWIPIVDFAIAFRIICRTLLKQKYGHDQFDFTESGDVIDCYRKDELVELRPSFEGDILTVNFEEFCNEVDRFYNAVLEDVFTANPFLKENKEFLRIISISSEIVN